MPHLAAESNELTPRRAYLHSAILRPSLHGQHSPIRLGHAPAVYRRWHCRIVHKVSAETRFFHRIPKSDTVRDRTRAASDKVKAHLRTLVYTSSTSPESSHAKLYSRFRRKLHRYQKQRYLR